MEKIIYALNLIVDFIGSNDVINERKITDYLSITGFEEYEIAQILSLLNLQPVPDFGQFRIFSKYEKRKFTQDAMNYLNKLIVLGILDILAIENIIETADNQNVYKITIEQVKELTLYNLLEKNAFTQENNYKDIVQ